MKDIKSRFWSKVNKGPKCWMWIGGVSSSGYGTSYIPPNSMSSHRVSWTIKYGSIPKGMFICHRCDNKLCVRPSHLFLGTQKDNMIDASEKKRLGKAKGQTHGRSKLTEKQVKHIRIDHRFHRIIALEYNINKDAVGKIKRKERWKHIK